MATQPYPGEAPSSQSTGRPDVAQGPSWDGPVGPPMGDAASTSIDIIDNQDELWVNVDLAGFTAEEIQLRGDEHQLTFVAERFTELEEDRSWIVQERPSRIQRTVPLPVSVDMTGAEAVLEDGVCKITLPKANADEYQEIEIRTL